MTGTHRPESFPEPLFPYTCPLGAIVDGYQLELPGQWVRIDKASEIDMDMFRGSSPYTAGMTDEQVADFWRESIGEMGDVL